MTRTSRGPSATAELLQSSLKQVRYFATQVLCAVAPNICRVVHSLTPPYRYVISICGVHSPACRTIPPDMDAGVNAGEYTD